MSETIGRPPGLSDPLKSALSCLDRDDHRAARAEFSRLIADRPTTAHCQAVAHALERLDSQKAELVELRVAILANVTAEPLAPILAARALPSGLRVRPYVAGFDRWAQEILDPESGLRSSNPDVVVLALIVESLCPPLVDGFLELAPGEVARRVDDTARRIEGAIDALRTWSRAKVLLHSVPLPVTRARGIRDSHSPSGQTAAFRSLNERLQTLAGRVPDLFIVDIDRLMASTGHAHWHDPRLWAIAKLPFTSEALHRLAEEYLRYLRAFAGRARKVLVVDLDDTLWGGVAADDGPQGIALGPEYPGSAFVDLQRAILELHRRGVVLAINSRNDPDTAMEILENHPAMVLRRERFAAVRINWQDKAANMLELAEELGLSLDSFVFVDDSEAECERVRQALPDVMTVRLRGEPAGRAQMLRSLGVFDTLSDSEEDRRRTTLYQTETRRRQLAQTMQSIEEFYQALQMELTIEPVSPATRARAAELTERTNQFNLTTRRYTRDELAVALAEPGREGYVFRLTDRFGDHGLIAFAMLEGSGPRLTISMLLVSCRVLKRTVEDAVLAFLVERARERGAAEIEGVFLPTRKNGQVSDLYPAHGFVPSSVGADGRRLFRRSTGDRLASSPWIRIVRETRGRLDPAAAVSQSGL